MAGGQIDHARLVAAYEAGGLDAVFLLKTAIPVMAALLILQGCAIILNNILVITGNNRPDKA